MTPALEGVGGAAYEGVGFGLQIAFDYNHCLLASSLASGKTFNPSAP